MQEIVTAGDLFSYIESKNGKLLEVEAAVIIRQILVALSFLHNKNIVHRDIKPDNVLMTSLAAGCRVILTDFGAARRIESKLHRMSSIIGTHEYAAPYVLVLASQAIYANCTPVRSSGIFEVTSSSNGQGILERLICGRSDVLQLSFLLAG